MHLPSSCYLWVSISRVVGVDGCWCVVHYDHHKQASQALLRLHAQVYHQLRWNLIFCGTPEDMQRQKQGLMPDKFMAKSSADVFINEEENLVFQGVCVCVCVLVRILNPLPCMSHHIH